MEQAGHHIQFVRRCSRLIEPEGQIAILGFDIAVDRDLRGLQRNAFDRKPLCISQEGGRLFRQRIDGVRAESAGGNVEFQAAGLSIMVIVGVYLRPALKRA